MSQVEAESSRRLKLYPYRMTSRYNIIEWRNCQIIYKVQEKFRKIGFEVAVCEWRT